MISSRRPFVAMAIISAMFIALAVAAVWFVVSQPAPARGFTGRVTIEELHVQEEGCSASVKLPDGLEEIVNIGKRDFCETLSQGSVINVKSGRYLP